jgi:SAM-dependent methyltransferase
MDKQQWQDECQTFELDFHQKENYRWNRDAFGEAWRKHFEDWCRSFAAEPFLRNSVVLDIGCGSAPAVDYFEHSVRYYLDPLIDKYIKIPEVAQYWGEDHMKHALSGPAETYWQFLHNACSFINCWNVLDHCYDWRKVVDNMIKYARRGCIVSFSTDYNPHKGHAGIDNTEELYMMLASEFEVLKDEPGYWGRDMALLLVKK